MRMCKVDGCEDKVLAHNLCHKHLRRFYKYRDPLFTKVQMHGLTKHPLYHVWQHMMHRCYNKKDGRFCYYGRRGITVCQRWHQCANFIEDMYPTYKKGLQIDRKDNDGGYTKDNCRWITHTEQQRNKSNNKLSIEKVRKIRVLCSSGTVQKKVAELFGVSPNVICGIAKGRYWKEESLCV